MYVLNSKVFLQARDLDQTALRIASDHTGLSVDDVARAVIEFQRAVDELAEARRGFEMNGQDRY